jgi:dienelactone hydrolase
VTLALLAILTLRAFAQTDANVFGLDPGEHAVGFRLLEDEDRSRAVTGGSREAAHPRPIRTYLWYPAEASRRAQPLSFGRYAALAGGDIWPAEIVGDLGEKLKYSNGPLARSLDASSFTALLERPMRAVENAAPLAGPFPLVVIALGLYYESPVTFSTTAEYLAGRGFVVATAPLVGTHVPLVKLDVQDLETQMRDLELVIARARQLPFVDQERLGVMGFDQGGMAGVVLTMRNRDVDAFVSLDSGIQYPHVSGLPRSSPHFDPLALRVPWLHAASRGDGPPPADGTKSLYDEALHSDRAWLRIASLGHADFTSYALVADRAAATGYWGPATPAGMATHRSLMQYVEHFLSAKLRASAASAAFLEQDIRQTFPDAGMTLEHRSAVPAAIGYDELVRKVVGGRADEAIAELKSLAASPPAHPMLSEFNLGRLCVSLLYTWNLAEQALPLIEYSLELYPMSGGGKALLAEAQIALKNYAAAIETYEQLLTQFPGEPSITARLEWLRAQP